MVKKFDLFDGRTRMVDDLMSHADKLKEDPIVYPRLQQLAKHFIERGVVDSEDELLKRYGQLKTNDFYITPSYYEKYYMTAVNHGEKCLNDDPGVGLYIEGSYFNHSCRPNACRNCDGLTMQFRALDHIDTDKQEITVHYTFPLRQRAVRLSMLKSGFNFDCTCSRCTSSVSDDDKCARYMELRSLMSAYERCGQYAAAYKAAKEARAINKQILGQYSHSGVEMLIGVMDNLLNSFSSGGPTSLSANDLKSLLKEVEESVHLSYGHNLNYYNVALKHFQESVETICRMMR